MKSHLPFGLVALLAISILWPVDSVATAAIENPTCEPIAPDTYRIDFQASAEDGPIQIFASSHPDRIDSPKPLRIIRDAPVDVSVPGFSGRVYFHLKPGSGPTRVVSIRRLPLEGAKNFRDLGGYRATDGRYVRWGLVYRSNFLVNLTPNDSAYLNGLGIRLVCDVRAEAERARAPDHWAEPAPEFLDVPIGPKRDGTLSLEEVKLRVAAANAHTPEAKGYDYAITDAAQYGKILRRLSAGDLPAVEHCTSGKDRTGVFSAILLTALGVPRDVVLQDYLLTNKYMLGPDAIESTTADLQRIFGLPEPPDPDTVNAIMTARPQTLETTLENISKTYGSFDNYLQKVVGLSDSELARLRDRLLQP